MQLCRFLRSFAHNNHNPAMNTLRPSSRLRTLVLLVCCSIGFSALRAKDRFDMDSILSVLDTCIRYRDAYENQHIRYVDSLRRKIDLCPDEKGKLELWMKIGMKESSRSSGAALQAFNNALSLARSTGDARTEHKAIENKAILFGELGMPWEGERLLDSLLHSTDLHEKERISLFKAYNDIYDYFRTGRLPEEVSDRKLNYITAYADSLKKRITSPVDLSMLFNYGSTNIPSMIQTMQAHLDTVPDAQKGVAAVVLSNKYALLKDVKGQEYYWAVSAIYNQRTCQYEYEPLIRLAGRLFDKGDVDRAIRYMLAAFDNAEIYGTNVRKAELAPILTKGLKAKAEECRAERNEKRWWRAAAILLGGLLLAAYAFHRRERKKMKRLLADASRAQEKLPENNETPLPPNGDTRNENISQFLELSLDAVYEVEQLKQLVLRKLKTGELERLNKMLNDPSRGDTFRKECLKRFDVTFFRLYPNFTEAVNRLLLPDGQITPPGGELMNNELRILAFLRLGITDGAKIAAILGISVNTIYFYRNRLRRHAIQRDNFEKQVAQL